MSIKIYNLSAGGHNVLVEAEQEAAARFMVRMSVPGKMAKVRIGYLTGARRTWVVEFFGKKKPSIVCDSAKEACQELANWAVKQETITKLLSSQMVETAGRSRYAIDDPFAHRDANAAVNILAAGHAVSAHAKDKQA